MEAVALRPREPRKNLMLAAQIAAGSVCAPVRIRNLSESGAMIDGGALPEPGSRFVLRRLDLQVNATAVWTKNGRCGVKLAGQIDIEEWIAGVHKPMRGGTLGQLRVDQIQAAIRSGEALPVEAPAAEPVALSPLLGRLAAEISGLEQLVGAVADRLSDDTEVLMRHEQALQQLDLAAQTLNALAAVTSADDPERAIAAVAMHDLRSRLSGAPTLT